MRFIPGDDVRYLDRWEVGDTDILGIANEKGDITAYVRRADGTTGHAYGGPVYDPPEFENVCARADSPDSRVARPCDFCSNNCEIRDTIRRFWLTDGELATATALAKKVGWL